MVYTRFRGMFFLLLAATSSACFTTTAKAADPVTVYIATYAGEYLAGKAIDAAWDSVTGKPDIRVLDQRLKEFEENAVMRSEMRDEIRKLRMSIDDRITREEFQSMVEKTTGEIT